MKNISARKLLIQGLAIATLFFFNIEIHAITIPATPLLTQTTAKPMVMLVAGRDHKLFYESYNDTADIDGDGSIDLRFKPSITYYGLFDSSLCYSHNAKSDKDGLFTPTSLATGGKCKDAWSGNWLNYQTTARIDALRKVLYGGHREIDTADQTILRRAYIPQDAHSWGKEYTSKSIDGYLISDYTPLKQPSENKRHLFGNLTQNAGKSCTRLDDCSDLPPHLSVVTDTATRIWNWASTENPVLANNTHGGTRKDYTVRVEVCTSAFNSGCKQYGTKYKPTGLLHDYGENDSMLFGLITGSYDSNLSGGILRKVVSKFSSEVSPDTGVFTLTAPIVETFNKFRIRDFNNTKTDNSYKGGWESEKAMTEGKFPDWGNPIAEMMYEGVRYFAGKKVATSSYQVTTSVIDAEVGLNRATWDDPYSTSSAAKSPWCAKANFLTISDINPSYDSDQLPGSQYKDSKGKPFSGDVSGLDVSKEADTISSNESSIVGKRFIGESKGVFDSAPSAKDVESLKNIRGLAPEEPTKQGSYYSASVASFAKRNDIRSDVKGSQSIDTFSVALASPLPKIEVAVDSGRTITLVPFAKSVLESSKKGGFQPTNQIVDFYVTNIANSGTNDKNSSINEGRYYAKFQINFEDVEQGADHDMDAITEYEIKLTKDKTLEVNVKPTYQAGGAIQNMGYIISGTTKDGVYLVVQDSQKNKKDVFVDIPYFLNVPSGKEPGFCDNDKPDVSCNRLPTIGSAGDTRTFVASSTPAATLLKDPLWYAAKWGGFTDKNNNGMPDLQPEWDSDANGVPDTYFLVQNPIKLKETIKKAFDSISVANSSASNVITNSSKLSTSARTFQARFDAKYWSGDLVSYPIPNAGVSMNTAWKASTKMPAASSRKIFLKADTPNEYGTGVARNFTWEAVSTNKMVAEILGSEREIVDYFRGVRTNEIKNGGRLRDRSDTVLGDIIHSSPIYLKDTDTIFVGSNAGMLHAFNAQDGVEQFAHIPQSSLVKLKKLSSPFYTHDYYVDGEIEITSRGANTGGNNYLFATLGRGGKGLFALDVTSTAAFDATKHLWEYTPAASSAASTDLDLGFMLGRPALVKMNNGKSAVIVGNGYNSTSGLAVLYFFMLDVNGAITEVKKISTKAANDNGLSTPGMVDTNGDGLVDLIYAGDLKGNLWKFDVSSEDSSKWTISNDGKPLFIAIHPDGQPQPITAKVSSAVNNVTTDINFGKRFVFLVQVHISHQPTPLTRISNLGTDSSTLARLLIQIGLL
ncbi:pilus assembly protein [Rhodoferax aquaticus]|uniref:Pilus assembly protein n=1 Tax=Rhodoferax aquaticus TaxID=2527691 RepID=A0A515ENM8_9BURK|nr:PilC/PilY family type IV pilus protein [Rhodoferax aquaticus]QDL54234.1 pilus assembly protein [Rhodoferax aquaticus]